MTISRSLFGFVPLFLVSNSLWATGLTSNNSFWTAFTFLPPSQGGNSGQIFDPPNDQQTGDKASDFVGSATTPGLYMGFDGLGDSNPLTGNLMFRARMGTINTPDFSSAFIIGIDANLDGQIDVFVGADNRSANGKAIKIWGGNCSKTPCNISPSTTGLGTQVGSDIPETAANYNYTFVTSGFDVGNTNFDVDGDGATDAFVTFSVDYSLVANYLNTLGLVYPSGQGVNAGPVPAFDDHSPMRIIAVTSQQSNSFNQDLGGCAVINSAVNWTNCGMSSTFTPYQVDVPEPGTILLAGAGIASLLYLRRRKTQA